MPLMPAREPRPEPLARAQARHAFDDLVRRRQTDLDLAHAGDRTIGEQLAALARSFADEVDRENSTRGILRAGVPVDYVDAVLLGGGAGYLVVDAPEYDAAPVYWQSRVAGGTDAVDLVVRGRDLDGYLRSGDKRYAEQLGLPS